MRCTQSSARGSGFPTDLKRDTPAPMAFHSIMPATRYSGRIAPKFSSEAAMLKSVPAAGAAAAHYSPEEWAIRVDLAAAYRLVAHFHWDDLVFTHITARVPGPEHHFLINPYGMTFDEITSSGLVKIDMQGNNVTEHPCPTNPAA